MGYTIAWCRRQRPAHYTNISRPYAATSIGEYFMEAGRDVLIVYDDLTNTPAPIGNSRSCSGGARKRGFPGDIFTSTPACWNARHPPERGKRRRVAHRPAYCGTEAQNIAAYIPTNLISITDGQIYLSPPFSDWACCPPSMSANPFPRGRKPNWRFTAPPPATSSWTTPSLKSWKPSPALAPAR